MKTRLNKLKLIAILGGALASTAAYGQATGNASQTNFVWIDPSVLGDLATATNWTPAGVPNSARNGSSSDYGDIMEFDGQTTGPVIVTSNTGSQTGSSVGGTTAGIYVYINASQTSPVTFCTTVANSVSSGIRFNGIVIDPGAGSFSLGHGSTTNCLDTVWGTANPSGQGLTNNSANPAFVYPDMRWRLGAGGAHTFTFGGTGNWIITNYIANANGSSSLIQKDGSGTMFWTGGQNAYSAPNSTIGSPLGISGGTLMLMSSGLIPSTTTINNTAGLLEFNALGGNQTFANPVNGAGTLQVNNGTLTLSGANTYAGNTILSGGELVVNHAESPGANGPLGVGGIITFTGGTLGFSAVDTYDYSSRFDPVTTGQSYSFDTGGQDVTLATALASSGGTLTKLGSGTLTLSGANTYSGLTTVSAGKLVLQGTAGLGNITVANSTALGVTAGSQIAPATLTVGTTSGATLEFNGVNSTATPLIVAGTISAGGPITININSGVFNTIGQNFPLMSWTGGSAPAVTLGTVVGAGGTLSVSGSTLYFNVTSLAFIWTGLNPLADWDLTTANEWKLNGSATVFQNGGTALFDDTAPGQTNILLNAPVSPASTTISASVIPYTITSSGADLIGGSGGLTKSGSSFLTLAGGVNTYTGVTTINGGTASVGVLANGGSASDIGAAGNAAANLVLNGGTLQFTGSGLTSDHLFTLGTAGGAIDVEGSLLTLSNPGNIALSGTGARTLTLSGDDSSGDTLSAVLGDNGGPTAMTTVGTGLWIMTALNTYSGVTTIHSGSSLQVGTGGASSIGTGAVLDNGYLQYNTSATITNGVISGTGSVDLEGPGTLVLSGNNTFSGGTTVNNGTLQVGTGGATGSLFGNGAINDNSTIVFDTSSLFYYSGNGLIAGGGNVIVRGGGILAAIGGNTYNGWTEIDPGSTFQPCQGNTGGLDSSVVTNNGTLLLVRQDNGVFVTSSPIVGTGKVVVDANNFNPGDVTLAASNSYTGGTYIGDNGLIIDNGSGQGWITGNVIFTNSTQVPNDNPRSLQFDRPDNVTFPGNITGPGATLVGGSVANAGEVQQNGSGVLTLTGSNTYLGGTIISAGVLQVGNGGTGGSIGSGTVSNNTALIFDLSSSVTLTNVIDGAGSLAQVGTGTLTLAGTNTYTGDTAVSNGVLVVDGAVGGELDVSGGTVVAGPAGSTSTLDVTNNLDINSGTVSVTLNKSSAQSNSVFSVGGTITALAGTVQVANAGPVLKVGDRFVLFSQAVSGGLALTVTGGGATWINDLATDGSIIVNTVTVVTPPKLSFAQSGNNLQFSWTGSFHLQVETNSLSTGLSNNWVNYSGGGTSPVTVPVNSATTGTVFFRLSQ